MKKHLLAIAMSAIILSACGKETIIREVVVTAAPVESTTTTTTTQAPQETKFDRYLNELYQYSGQARSWDEADLLEFGSIVCDSFDAGNSLDDIVGVMSEYSSGSYDDELFAGIILSSVVHLCPEHESYVQAQL